MGLADSIKQLRENNDMTQEQFGKVAGVSAMAVSQWENGRAVPRMGAIQRLSDHFGVPKSQIIGESAIGYSVISLPSRSELTVEELEIIEDYRRMDNTDKKLFRNMARTLAFAGDQKKEDARRAAGGDREAVTDGRGGHHA